VHRQVPQALPPSLPAPTGVDYLGLVLAAHDAETLGQLAFRDLPSDDDNQTENHHRDHQPPDDHSLRDHQPDEDHQP
jgi:ABC-type Zn2+ transport system substrate-binding protein/surface adhesin